MLNNKVTIIGAGYVGSTIAYTLMLSALVNEIALIDIDREKSEGEVLDLKHCMPALLPVNIHAGDYRDCADSKMIIITAGFAQKKNQSRLALIQQNVEVFKSIIENIRLYYKNSIILVVTNPVDILTYVTIKLLPQAKHKIFGSGTVLDTARFRLILSKYMQIDSRNVNAYIIGEHGDSSVPVWSLMDTSWMANEEFQLKTHTTPNLKQLIHEEVVKSAYRIIEKKGATYYGIAVGVRTIVESVLRNQNTILTVSSMMNGQYGIDDVCISLPTVIDSLGVKRVLNLNLDHEEVMKLRNSANILRNIILQLNYNNMSESDLEDDTFMDYEPEQLA